MKCTEQCEFYAFLGEIIKNFARCARSFVIFFNVLTTLFFHYGFEMQNDCDNMGTTVLCKYFKNKITVF